MAERQHPTPTGTEPGVAFSLRWLLTPDRSTFVTICAFAVGLGILTLAVPIAVQAMVNFIAFGGLMQPLVVVGTLLFLTLAFAGAIRIFKFYLVEILQRRIFVRVTSALTDRLPRTPVAALDTVHGPELANRFFDVMTIQKAGAKVLIDGLDVLLQTGIGLIVLGFYHPFLMLFALALALGITLVIFVLGNGAIQSAKAESRAKYRVAAALQEILRLPNTFKLAGASEHAREHLTTLSTEWLSARSRHYRVVMRQMIGSVVLHTVAATGLLAIGGYLVILGQLSLGQLVAAELIVSLALASFVKFGKEFQSYYDMRAAVGKVAEIFALPTEPRERALLESRDHPATVTAHGIPWSTDVSRGTVDLEMLAGERLAILGPRGSGKSHLADLLAGLRLPEAGAVSLDGIDLRQLGADLRREDIELIRGIEIVDGDVLANLLIGHDEHKLEAVSSALAKLGIQNDIEQLPLGLRTPLFPDGAPLSQQTATLLMIARALLGTPRWLIVDAALDVLDPRSLDAALDALTDPAARWTLVVLTAQPAIAERFPRVLRLGVPDAGGGPR